MPSRTPGSQATRHLALGVGCTLPCSAVRRRRCLRCRDQLGSEPDPVRRLSECTPAVNASRRCGPCVDLFGGREYTRGQPGRRRVYPGLRQDAPAPAAADPVVNQFFGAGHPRSSRLPGSERCLALSQTLLRGRPQTQRSRVATFRVTRRGGRLRGQDSGAGRQLKASGGRPKPSLARMCSTCA